MKFACCRYDLGLREISPKQLGASINFTFISFMSILTCPLVRIKNLSDEGPFLIINSFYLSLTKNKIEKNPLCYSCITRKKNIFSYRFKIFFY